MRKHDANLQIRRPAAARGMMEIKSAQPVYLHKTKKEQLLYSPDIHLCQIDRIRRFLNERLDLVPDRDLLCRLGYALGNVGSTHPSKLSFDEVEGDGSDGVDRGLDWLTAVASCRRARLVAHHFVLEGLRAREEGRGEVSVRLVGF
jgi:hypothetical protein